jgi:hypothetical protein
MMKFPIYGKIKNVTNHKPYIYIYLCLKMGCTMVDPTKCQFNGDAINPNRSEQELVTASMKQSLVKYRWTQRLRVALPSNLDATIL